jgi:undecaprenyl-diphosphatase
VTETLVSPPAQPTIALPRTGAPAMPGVRLPLLAALIAGAGLLSLTAAGNGTLGGDVAITRWVQRIVFPGSGQMTALANWAGGGLDLTVIAVACVLLLAVARRFQAASLILAAMLLQGVNPLLKAIADSPRPTPDLVRVTEQAAGAGFPSGHVMGTTLFYGVIIYLAPTLIRSVTLRRFVQGAAAFMIIATGFARISTGAHWPSDVLGGYLWGALCLLLLIRGYHAVVNAPTGRRLTARA